MAGPWEKYTAPAPAPVVGPWAKRKSQAKEEKGLWQTLKENVIGDNDPTTQNMGEKIGTLLNMGGESMTFGLVGDEAAAGADAMIGRGGSYDENLARYRGNEAQVREQNPVASFAADVAPALIPGVGIAGAVGKGATLPGMMARGLGAGAVAGGTLGFMEGEGGADNRMAAAIPSAALGGVVGGATPALGALAQKAWQKATQGSTRAGMAAATPSVDDLLAQAGSKYDEARALGVTATRPQTQAIADQTRGIASREGIITPTGRIAESYPRVRDAINMADDFSAGTMDPAQMQAVRRTYQGVAGSADGAERRIGSQMLREFDNAIEPLAPQFKEANALYARAKRGELVNEAIELAGVRAGQFSGSGFENALRTEFRRLSRDIVKGNIKGITPDQAAAIRKVAEGGPIENIMRGIGKAAPTGVVSAGIGGGMPFLVGNALGGPVVGAAAGAGTMAAGALGRKVATGMTTKNAEFAAALMRSATGANPTNPQAGTALAQLLQQAMLGNAGNLGEGLSSRLGLSAP